jgi:hypothetical protein
MFYYCLVEEREEKERRKKEREIAMREEGFLGARSTLLAVPRVTALRCN